MTRIHLVFLDPETRRWIIAETGPHDLIMERLQVARNAPGNYLKWSVLPLLATTLPLVERSQ
jgi:hypothetical protein